MSTSTGPAYSETTVDHFRQPRNVGWLPGANASGTVDDPSTENIINLYLTIEDDRIVAARFRTFGCSACIATSSMTTVLVIGKKLVEARAIDRKVISRALGGLPTSKRHCAGLAAAALKAALASYTPSA